MGEAGGTMWYRFNPLFRETLLPRFREWDAARQRGVDVVSRTRQNGWRATSSTHLHGSNSSKNTARNIVSTG
ncbi:hypothetical protein [Paraburkholderia sacchari]|uniref:hypothetical protein n=1 Tax=Paraburkholderia sacchari TaxID=159450 RepID=UPI001BCF2803|nr:hypothetical protein [Paraburkholderia sacchari]